MFRAISLGVLRRLAPSTRGSSGPGRSGRGRGHPDHQPKSVSTTPGGATTGRNRV
jgi:hypothetical protein